MGNPGQEGSLVGVIVSEGRREKSSAASEALARLIWTGNMGNGRRHLNQGTCVIWSVHGRDIILFASRFPHLVRDLRGVRVAAFGG